MPYTEEIPLDFKPSTDGARTRVRAVDDDILALEYDSKGSNWNATAHDVREMDLFGIEPAFKRRFKFIAMVGFASTVVMCWQNTLATFSFALTNGGTGGYFFTYLYALFAFAFVYLSLAELSSSYPTAGGQYQWVAQCAPLKFRTSLSYCTGWLCSLAWLGYLAACGVIIGNMVHDMAILYYPDSASFNSQWFPTTIAIAALVVGGLFNGRLAKQFPMLEGVMLVIHMASWAAFVVTLWVTSPRGNPRDVLLTFNNGGGWSSSGTASLIGVLTACSSLLGYDSAVHMTENAKDASYTVPWSLVIAYAFNAGMGFIAGVTVIFCAGDLTEVLANGTQAPFVTIFYNSTGSKAGTVVMLVAITLCFLSSMISEVATASRQIWAFARDDGLPMSHRLKSVSDGEVPQTALWTTVGATFVITCVNFGSAVGFNAIISLVSMALTFSYMITMSCTIWQRIWGAGIPKERFSLGVFGLPCNILGVFFIAPIMVLSPFPPYAHVTAANMNYAILIFGVVVLGAIVNYIVSGRKKFVPTLRKEE
ncbi:hypothetical protein LTR36_010049 [Oleoguttula mirabilis]|uniref:Amino acid transporter n=1 Tax=Oleoguttula mirabilis TaxID=1507867 RepID=A0AAV9JRS0_9PEZI|nr:hypothetical protein LTR36_010049 [Oleoguttula mirabilis]